MTHKLRFHSAIPDDIFDALAYYDKISRTLGNRFPYLIFFVVKSNFVLILAIVHGSSDPEKWRTRD